MWVEQALYLLGDSGQNKIKIAFIKCSTNLQVYKQIIACFLSLSNETQSEVIQEPNKQTQNNNTFSFHLQIKQGQLFICFPSNSGSQKLAPYIFVNLHDGKASMQQGKANLQFEYNVDLYEPTFGSIFSIIPHMQILMSAKDSSNVDIIIPHVSIQINPNTIQTISQISKAISWDIYDESVKYNSSVICNMTAYIVEIEWNIVNSAQSYKIKILPRDTADITIPNYDSTILRIYIQDKTAYECSFKTFFHELLESALEKTQAIKKIEFNGETKAMSLMVCMNCHSINSLCLTLLESCIIYQSITPKISLVCDETLLPYFDQFSESSVNRENKLISISSSQLTLSSFKLAIDKEDICSFKFYGQKGLSGNFNISDDMGILWSKKSIFSGLVDVIQFSAPFTIENKMNQKLDIIFQCKEKKRLYSANYNEKICLFPRQDLFSQTSIQFLVLDKDLVLQSQQYLFERLCNVTIEGRYLQLINGNEKVYVYIYRNSQNYGLSLFLTSGFEITNSSSQDIFCFEKRVQPSPQTTLLLPLLNYEKIPIKIAEDKIIEIESKKDFAIIQSEKEKYLLCKYEKNRASHCYSTYIFDLVSLKNNIKEPYVVFINGKNVSNLQLMPIPILQVGNQTNVNSIEEVINLLKTECEAESIRISILNSDLLQYECKINLHDLLCLKFIDVFDSSHSECINLELCVDSKQFPLVISIQLSHTETITRYALFNFTQEQIEIERPKISYLGSNLFIQPHKKMYLTGTELADPDNNIFVVHKNYSQGIVLEDSKFTIDDILCSMTKIGKGGVITFWKKEMQTPIESSNFSLRVNIEIAEIKIFPYPSYIPIKEFISIELKRISYFYQIKESNTQFLQSKNINHAVSISSLIVIYY